MNRRDFIRSSGAAGLASLLVPSWLLPKSLQAKTINLGLFCDDYSARYDMTQPFMQGDRIYATDARVAIRVGRDLVADLAGDEARLPPADRLSWPDDDTAGWRPVSELERVKWNQAFCGGCFGRGRSGTDVEPCPCEYMETCSRHGASCIGWTGGRKCDECDGIGYVDWCWSMDGHFFGPSYIAKLDTLPGLELRVDKTVMVPGCDPKRNSPVLQSRFDGGVGLLMPLDPAYRNK